MKSEFKRRGLRMRFAVLLPLLVTAACCLGGCARPTVPLPTRVFVMEMVADKEIPAGSVLKIGDPLFKQGKSYDKGKEPQDRFLYNWTGMLEGKKVAKDLKKGDIVKSGDIVEPDGSAFQKPKGF